MKTKNQNPVSLLDGKSVDSLTEVYFEFNHLKQLFRQGWLIRGIPDDKCESIADHLFGVIVLILFIIQRHFPKTDLLKLLKMAIVHEFGKIYIGEITPSDHIPKSVEFEWEYKSISKIFSKIPNGDEYIGLWKEYEERRTEEARLVREIDILEAALQTTIYKLQYRNGKFDDFAPWAQKRIKNKILLKILDDAKSLISYGS